MRRFVGWIAGTVGGLAAYRLVRRRAATEPLPEPSPSEPDERAEELRAKLAEARLEEEPPAAPSGPAPPESLEERRRRVYEQGRATIDEMQSE